MAFAAIRYHIKDGYRNEITEIFGNFRRVDDPVVRDDSGTQVGRILATAVFLEGPTMVRVIQYEGDLDEIARYMAVQPGVRRVERELAPYLASPRHTSTPEDFVETFRGSLMRCISHLPPPGVG
jgi:hypothetical protein